MSGNAPPRLWEIPILIGLYIWMVIKEKADRLWRRITGRAK